MTHATALNRYYNGIKIYLLVAEQTRGGGSWREIEFLATLRAAFQLSGSDMDEAAAHARLSAIR